jgi:septal ring factor EnvC (AmiA/AmiB activator)
MKFLDALKREAFAQALCKAVGFNLDAATESGNRDALRAWLVAKNPRFKDAEAIKATHAQLTRDNTQKRAELADLKAQGEKLKTDLTKLQGQYSSTEAALAAVEAKIENKAHELLAKHGVNSGGVEQALSTKKFLTKPQFDRLTPAGKSAFSKNGGRITE